MVLITLQKFSFFYKKIKISDDIDNTILQTGISTGLVLIRRHARSCVNRNMYLVTAIGNVTDYDPHNSTLFLTFDVDLGPSTEPGVTAMLTPAPAEFRSVVML